MSFLKSLFDKKDPTINTYSDFWSWFQKNQNKFHKVVKQNGDIHGVFFSKLSPKLNELKDGIWFLTGMFDKNTAELILTSDGVIKNIVFIEELVAAAPIINNWKITALKQPSEPDQFGIELGGYKFDNSKLNFYSTNHKSKPDEIDITITHEDLNDENIDAITNGVYLSLDNYIGELNSVTKIDNLNIINPHDAKEDLVPFEKIKSFLTWREKEFVEKYKGLRNDTENDNYSILEATLDDGMPLIATINTDLLDWENKASHPWIGSIKFKYDGSANNGLPNDSLANILNKIEDELIVELKDSDGYLNIGRQTADSVREIYFACFDFREPSKVFYKMQKKYNDEFNVDYDIYKDKYWYSFNRFKPN